MAEKLTPQQAQAVRDRGGKLLVSAAAGSGKTKVLVDRLMGYLTDPVAPANLDDFLIITYTKAAASELRGKIAAKLSERIAQEPENRHLQRQMQRLFLTKISTVHGFCSDLLREYAYRLDLAADFRVADENECTEIRETVLHELLEQAYENPEMIPDFRAFVDTQGLGRDDRLVPDIVQKVYDSARCHLDPEGWLEASTTGADAGTFTDAGETPWGRYLIRELHTCLEDHTQVLTRCVEQLQAAGLEKPAARVQDALNQLNWLKESATWDEVIARKDINYGRLTWGKNRDPELEEKVKAAWDACKEAVKKKLRCFSSDSKQILADLAESGICARGLIGLVKCFSLEYDRAKRSRRILDFGDLEHKTLDLVLGRRRSGPTAVAAEIGERFREIMVDEYQDSNGVQDAIFSALTQKRQNCFMVGDVKQSIYQFRLADPAIFLEKYHHYVPAGDVPPLQGRKVLLSSNFRSGAEVISAVNDVFETCMSPEVGGLVYGEEEALREGIPHIALPDEAVELYGIEVQEDNHGEEAAFVAQRIKEMLDGTHMVRSGEKLRPIEPEDIVILLRSPGSVAHEFQQALESVGVRCVSGAGADLLTAEEILTVRCLLEVISNPRQDIPLIGTLASPVFGFTADDLAAVRGKKKAGSIYDALLSDDGGKAKCFVEQLSRFRRKAQTCTVSQLLEYIFAQTRLDSLYAAMVSGDTKSENLHAFYQLAVDFEQESRRDLPQFLEHLRSMEGKKLITGAAANGSGAVTIMSIHKSKGLEFPVVFLSGLSKGFNRDILREQVVCDKELGLGLSAVDTQNRLRYPTIPKRAIMMKTISDSLSEEMRVLYVAMTRARDRLIMTYAAKKLTSHIRDISQRLDTSGPKLLAKEVSCPGEWVLIHALQRMEAGELFTIGDRPATLQVSDHPWLIHVVQATANQSTVGAIADVKRELPVYLENQLKMALNFRYPYEAATLAPSKQTATQRKGRAKDQEAAEHTREPKLLSRMWRKPSFHTFAVQGKTYGSAMHAVLQYIRYEACSNADGVRNEIERLLREGFISPEQAQLIRPDKIATLFSTELGAKLCNGVEHVREFKFSILDDGNNYGTGLEGEQVLLQGVVDCALLESDGITVLDFKTDFVTEETLGSLIERYRPQVATYADALRRIYEMPIKESYLYFFHLDRFVVL